MTIKNKKRFAIFNGAMIIILLVIIGILISLFSRKTLDLTNSLHAIICEDSVSFKDEKNKEITLHKGDLVDVIQDNFLSNSYMISFEEHVGEISKSSAKYYKFHPHEKYSLMVDVSEFNMRDNFSTSADFAFFVIDNGINYVYMRIGGRGYGEKGNMYYDKKVTNYIAICDFLKIPYGFYYLDEALNDAEIHEEVQFVKNFLEKNPTEMNVLPLAIDLEFQEGKGRADKIWKERTPLLEKLMNEFKKENISCIIYANAKRANEFLASLDADFWVARYPQEGIIPNSNFSEFINSEQSNVVINYLLDKNHKLKTTVDKNKEFVNSYSGDFLEKIIGWQFTSEGAKHDGIEEVIDLSVVNNAYFKKYLSK